MYTTLKPARTDYTLYGYERTDYPDADNAVVYRRDYTATDDTRKPERYSVVAYAGNRGAKDKTQDVQEAINSLLRYLEMQTENENDK